MTRTVPAGLTILIRAVVVAVIAAVLCGCAIRQVMAPGDFSVEERRLTDLIDNTTNPYDLSDLYDRRARLRVMAFNPQPNYKGALKDFNAALDLDSGRGDAGYIRDWIAVLSRLAAANQDTARLKTDYEKTERQNLTLKNNIDQLEKQEKELRKTIEELQSLELLMEQRRQQLR